jgi:hypothetical protein
MRTITQLNGVEFLRGINRARHAVEKLMVETNVLSIIRKPVILTGKETADEITAKNRAQLKHNLNSALDMLLEENPELTYECIMSMCVLDEGEPEPDGVELVMAAFNLISDKRVVDFLLQLGKSGLLDTGN